MRPRYVKYKGGCAIAARKTWAQMQRRGKGRGLEVERRLGCGELGIAWTRTKNAWPRSDRRVRKAVLWADKTPPRGWQWQIEKKHKLAMAGGGLPDVMLI